MERPSEQQTHGADHWREQAQLAWDYAFSRPASDMKGFFDALRDMEEFLRRAALAAEPQP